MRKVHNIPKGRGRGGQAVVEFALVLPLFVMLVFGALEFGRAYYCVHLLTNAAREGARTGSLPGKLESDVEASVDNFLNSAGLSGSWSTTVVVTDPDGTERSGLSSAQESDSVDVTVSYDFTVLSGSVVPGFSGTVPLSGQCAFRHE